MAVADAFFQVIICRFGMPAVIHSDQGREFENHLMQELCLLLGAHKTHTTPYHPASDGLVECFNRTLHMMLAMFAGEHRNDWDYLVPVVMGGDESGVAISQIPDFLGLYSLIPDFLGLYSLIPDFWGLYSLIPDFRPLRPVPTFSRPIIMFYIFHMIEKIYMNAYPPPPY